jgi:hypothetical protein
MAITYTPTTNFGAKDSLPTNDPDKVIKGSEFTTEFTAIQTAFSLAAPAASPTFTGTVTIPTADINGGNIDGTVIGAATPAAGSFTTGQFGTSLNVDGTVTADGLTVSGSVAAGAVLATISNSGANGAAQLYLNNDAQNWIVNTRVDDAFSVFNATSSKTPFLINTNGDISFYEDTGTTAKFFWDASAESLGIGTSSPDTALHVSSSSGTKATFERTGAAGSYIGLKDSSGSLVYLGGNSGVFEVQTPGSSYSTKLAITSAGNVGIGTSSPSGNLHVDGGEVFFSSTGNSKLQIKAGNTSSSFIEFGDPDDGNVGRLLYSHSDNSMQFTVNASEAMRIDSSQNLLVGTTDTTLYNNGAGGNTGVLLRGSVGNIQAARSDGAPVDLNRLDTNGDISVFAKDGTPVGSISVTASATAYNTSSDARLKENIADAEDAGAKVDAIQVRQFDWKADGSHQDYGMVAQELLTVAPEAVSGDPESDDMMGVDYSKLVPMMLKEIQSLRARVAQLEGV